MRRTKDEVAADQLRDRYLKKTGKERADSYRRTMATGFAQVITEVFKRLMETMDLEYRILLTTRANDLKTLKKMGYRRDGRGWHHERKVD